MREVKKKCKKVKEEIVSKEKVLEEGRMKKNKKGCRVGIEIGYKGGEKGWKKKDKKKEKEDEEWEVKNKE